MTMANTGFTRDEVILALDVLYFSGEKHLNEKAKAIKDLCALLQKLPIYSPEVRNEIFRNEHGVSNQIAGFRRSCINGVRNPSIGKMFFEVAFEFEDKKEELYRIAESIRRNLPYFQSSFGSTDEDDGFPEGILLSHLHRLIERKEGSKIVPSNRCGICQLEPEVLYKPCGNLLQQHLLVAPASMDGSLKYSAKDFITVCPNCHAALHRYRPWVNKENCGELLR